MCVNFVHIQYETKNNSVFTLAPNISADDEILEDFQNIASIPNGQNYYHIHTDNNHNPYIKVSHINNIEATRFSSTVSIGHNNTVAAPIIAYLREYCQKSKHTKNR